LRSGMGSLGPNTCCDEKMLQRKVLLCCGEQRGELLEVVSCIFGGKTLKHHVSHCFEFWKFDEFTLILSGMGTGCVEPLMWEILRPTVIRQIVLVGTAGRFSRSRIPIGRPCAIDRAYLAGTALDGRGIRQPLKPAWDMPRDLQTASSVSTDFFYGFSPRLLDGDYPSLGPRFMRSYCDHARKTDLIDMEVAPFYYFCRAFAPRCDLQYLAIKAAANTLGELAEQTKNSPAAIDSCVGVALNLLGVGCRRGKRQTTG
jgi:hypothetical protein